MYKISACEDLAICHNLWNTYIPQESIFDLWDIRECFAHQFKWKPYFVSIYDQNELVAFLPLSYVQELDAYMYFPGEIWHGRTWLERNRIITTPECQQILLENCPTNTVIRYLTTNNQSQLDEIGYLFHPPDYDYDIENYWKEFSGKSRKKLSREFAKLSEHGIEYRHNQTNDTTDMINMNLAAFGDKSYFHDSRFRRGFEDMIAYCKNMGWLRTTSMSIGGDVAAIDAGIIFNNEYILIAGGTNPSYPGVAKLINIHHMTWACENKLDSVDFLCGDFGWKERFHLKPRPLYEISKC